MDNLRIQAVRKDENGTIYMYKLSNGEVIDVNTAFNYVKEGKLGTGYAALHSRAGTPYIRSDANGTPDDNLDNLPEF